MPQYNLKALKKTVNFKPHSSKTQSNSSKEEAHKESAISSRNGISVALSLFYGIFIICLAIVCISSQYIASVGPLDLSEYYLNALYFVSIGWFFCFGLSLKWGCNKADAKQPIKSYAASNRWLKGVVAIFGFSIAIKDALEVIAIANIDSSTCEHQLIYLLMPILHCPFVFGQVGFLFFYVKHHIQECKHLARFGIMHIMVTNLSVWMVSVAKEATSALAFEREYTIRVTNSTNTHQKFDVLFQGNCTCSKSYCKRVIEAENFLFPFLIEFCLISTCLLYVSWKNVGKRSKEFVKVLQPNYRLFKSYKGPVLGALVLAATATVVIILGSVDKENFDERPTYLSQSTNLHLFEVFLISCEVINFAACFFGFYLYSQSSERKVITLEVNLDIVLLFVCFIGTMLAALFSILSLTLGSSQSKGDNWGVSFAFPIIDIFTTLIQILFIVYGLQQTANKNNEVTPAEPTPFSVCETVDKSLPVADCTQVELPESDEIRKSDDQLEMAAPSPNLSNHSSVFSNDENVINVSSNSISRRKKVRHSSQVSVFKVRVAPPDGSRMLLRDVLMFLVLSNASLWIFLSLDKTVFSTLTYQYEYYGHSIWTILTAITNPLSIFLRMHSAACFFQMWSFA